MWEQLLPIGRSVIRDRARVDFNAAERHEDVLNLI
jgi:hypothetical protein